MKFPLLPDTVIDNSLVCMKEMQLPPRSFLTVSLGDEGESSVFAPYAMNISHLMRTRLIARLLNSALVFTL
ncbi:uncharacterized protein PHALS_10861 [Plasmopara halstedii]|uniref:Uncharacterized protein n=1 Tax=Plasmopara halstedii TaxID=4781 RepID=A0A0N7L573_PLAHL|nr:uncharacterized protein PHALS_10861 [Plasmopara halstedii]CEG40675.1 hypothetical protein PHALS_10861 [Plasmopara halstedii]|eukprot:XP_024577044.1 hypothetical protein PHALS_10861 [Plasmopara halstedii]